MPDRDVVVVAVLNSVVESGILVEATDLVEVVLAHLEVEDIAVLLEVLLQAHSWEDHLLVTHVPVEHNLSSGSVVLLGELLNQAFVKDVKILHTFAEGASLKILVGYQGSIGSDRGLHLLIELQALILSEVWVHLEAVDGGAHVAEGQYLQEHNDWAIHDTDAAAKFLLSAVLHLAPDLLGGDSLNHQRILDNIGDHVMDEVEVYEATLKISNRLLEGFLNVVTVSDPQLADDEQIFALAEATLDNFLEGTTDSLLISINWGGIYASEAGLNCGSEALESVILIEVESAEAHGGHTVAVTKSAQGDVGNLGALLLLTTVHHLLLLRLGLYLTGCHLFRYLSYL